MKQTAAPPRRDISNRRGTDNYRDASNSKTARNSKGTSNSKDANNSREAVRREPNVVPRTTDDGFCTFFVNIGVTPNWECTFCPLRLSLMQVVSEENPWCPPRFEPGTYNYSRKMC
jgi:hypothetical protein